MLMTDTFAQKMLQVYFSYITFWDNGQIEQALKNWIASKACIVVFSQDYFWRMIDGLGPEIANLLRCKNLLVSIGAFGLLHLHHIVGVDFYTLFTSCFGPNNGYFGPWRCPSQMCEIRIRSDRAEMHVLMQHNRREKNVFMDASVAC